MNTIEIARKLALLGQAKEARQAYVLSLQQGCSPEEQMEAAVFVLQSGGDYRVSYTCFRELYNEGYFREDILPLMTAAFYTPNVKDLQTRYEHNCKLLEKYPYLFRRDFLPFDELPIQFFPYDDNGYVPFDRAEDHFGGYVNFGDPVVSRNFFKDLEKPVFAADVFSQYELEYLNDNVRKSEDVARENHIYLHYTDWGVFCSYLQCLNLRALLENEKFVFLIGDEAKEYPIDFKARFGIDYSQYTVQPVGIREINKLIWHTQLSTHNGGDFFNQIFDAHPNLLCLPSVMMYNIKEAVENIRKGLNLCKTPGEAVQALSDWKNPRVATELYLMRKRTDKDIMLAIFMCNETATSGLDPAARIAPAVFFQPHFHNIVYQLRANPKGNTILEAANYKEIQESAIFKGFKYIKTFTPMRRFTTSHGATVRFMHLTALQAEEKLEKEKELEKEQEKERKATGRKKKGQKKERKHGIVSDAVTERILNRSFMIDPEDRLYKDSVLVRLEDGKLNPKATFTALAAFLDLPYCKSMEVCSDGGEQVAYLGGDGYAPGFSPEAIYRTYDDYTNDSERYFIEYFLRDAYDYYGYDFQYYDGAEMDETKAAELIGDFTKIDEYMRRTWIHLYEEAKVTKNGERMDAAFEKEVQQKMLDIQMKKFHDNRLANAKILLEGLRFVNKNGQPLRMMKKLELDPELLEQPLYH